MTTEQKIIRAKVGLLELASDRMPSLRMFSIHPIAPSAFAQLVTALRPRRLLSR